MKNLDERYAAAVDLGSSAVRLCVARILGDEVEVVYYRETESEGVRASLIYNPRMAASKVETLIREAEDALMVRISQVVVGLPRKDVFQLTASMKLDRSAPDEYITVEELNDLKSLALDTYPLPDPRNQGIYGVVAQSFVIDDGMTLREREVAGTLSATIEGRFKVFVGRNAAPPLDKVFNGLGIVAARQYFLPEASARAVLSDVERNGGVALVDVGGGVTSVAIYQGGILRHFASIPFGGRTVTGDIETECSIPWELAEKIKVHFGACQPGRLEKLGEKVLQIRFTDPYTEIPVRYVSQIIDARCREIVEAILYHIEESGYANTLRQGVVVTGGGSELKNFVSLFEDMSGYRVRKGCPRKLFCSAVGNEVFTAPASAVLGMILLAKDEALPDCAEEPDLSAEAEPAAELAVEPAPVEPQATEPAPVREDGRLFGPDEFGGQDNEPKPAGNTRTVKVPAGKKTEKTGLLHLVWSTLGETALKVYDFINESEEKR